MDTTTTDGRNGNGTAVDDGVTVDGGGNGVLHIGGDEDADGGYSSDDVTQDDALDGGGEADDGGGEEGLHTDRRNGNGTAVDDGANSDEGEGGLPESEGKKLC